MQPERALQIFTHQNPDLDALLTIAAIRRYLPGWRDARVVFVPAYWKGEGKRPHDIAVDIEAGGQGIKGVKAGGKVYSAFAFTFRLLYQEGKIPHDEFYSLTNLTDFVDAVDVSGQVMKTLLPIDPRVAAASPEVRVLIESLTRRMQQVLATASLVAMLRCLKARHPGNDHLLVERVQEIFEGWIADHENKKVARQEAEDAIILPGGRVAILHSTVPGGNAHLYRQGVKTVVYKTGHDVGLTRPDDFDFDLNHPFIRAVIEDAGELDEWFFHATGFLVCRGGWKGRASTPSRVDPRKLALAADRALQESR